MHNAANVYLWGTHVGTVSLQDGNPIAAFQYTDAFRGMGVEISPVRMPLSPAVFSFPDLPIQSFHGLPGLLSDSLPDKFGNKVIAVWLREQNKSPEELNAIDRLCYAGRRGMGALEYRPALLDEDDVSERVTVEALSELADRVLQMRKDAKAALIPGMNEYSSILKVGSSAGGARAKAIIGWNEETGEVRSGQVKLPDGFGYWLIKFDGLVGNGDKEGDDKWGYGRVEYAYYLMARAAGIKMSECRLWNRRHFMTRRFDRLRPSRERRQAPHADARRDGAPRLQRPRVAFLRAGVPRHPPRGERRPRQRAAFPPDGVQRARLELRRPREEHILPNGSRR